MPKLPSQSQLEASKKLTLPSPHYAKVFSHAKSHASTSKTGEARHSHKNCQYHMNILSKEEHKITESLKKIETMLKSKRKVFRSVRSISPVIFK
mmetsp:Transcript_18605/g.33617  ORF Transcript_18605/g.33617 Transcript_18605/m.33617 type:complete len:94 (-) Transcript_18605:33-314(-)